MFVERHIRNLRHQKSARTVLGEGVPSNTIGHDGEFRLHTTGTGVKLYAKYNGKWYGFSPDTTTDTEIFTQDSDKSISDEGNVTFPGGLIMQWGKTDSTGTPVSVTFSMAFPNKCAAVISNSMAETAVGSTNIAVQTYGYTTTGFSARVLGSGGVDEGARNDGFIWLAIGN